MKLYCNLLQRVINIVLIFIISRYACVGIITDIFHLPTTIILLYICFILNCRRTFLLSQILNLFICGIFEHKVFAGIKQIHYLRFLIISNKCRNQVTVIRKINHWKREQYQGWYNFCERDVDSDLNPLASDNIWQYTTVPSQCERLPWTWMYRLLYSNCWTNFKKCPGSV